MKKGEFQMVLTSDMKKETNKKRIYDMMKKYYGKDTPNEEEDNYIQNFQLEHIK